MEMSRKPGAQPGNTNGFKRGMAPWNKGLDVRLNPKGEFKKEHTPWNKGKSWSEEVKVKLRGTKGRHANSGTFKKGHKNSENWRKVVVGKRAWNKGKIMMNLRGENSPLWKGGKTKERTLAMSRLEYRIWREAVFARDDWTCQMCSERGGKLEADHIKPWATYPEIRYAIDNGRTLCKSCHKQTDTYGFKFFQKGDRIIHG